MPRGRSQSVKAYVELTLSEPMIENFLNSDHREHRPTYSAYLSVYALLCPGLQSSAGSGVLLSSLFSRFVSNHIYMKAHEALHV